tara:strand:+ start:59 stop:541 length:483 start_codon:yes stop_codon:yes gene_type:complete
MKNQIVGQNGTFKNEELVKAMFYGYVRGRAMERLDLFQECVDDDIDENEIIVPEDIVDSFEYWGQMTMNFALAYYHYGMKKGDEVESSLECFYQEFESLKYIPFEEFEKKLIKSGKEAMLDAYNQYVGYTKTEDKQAQKWYTDLLKGQDNVINEVNNLIN